MKHIYLIILLLATLNAKSQIYRDVDTAYLDTTKVGMHTVVIARINGMYAEGRDPWHSFSEDWIFVFYQGRIIKKKRVRYVYTK